MKKRFLNIGWKSKLMLKRSTFSISINKVVAVGCNLKKGEPLYCYLAEDERKRPLILIYLDGKEGGDNRNQNITS